MSRAWGDMTVYSKIYNLFYCFLMEFQHLSLPARGVRSKLHRNRTVIGRGSASMRGFIDSKIN